MLYNMWGLSKYVRKEFRVMSEKFSRREFMKRTGLMGAAVYGTGLVSGGILGLMDEAEAATVSTMAIAANAKPDVLLRKAVDAVGGIKKFVKRGDTVLIKPNLAWAVKPEGAANTNPIVLEELIKLCKQAGAKRITMMEHTCDSSAISFDLSGAKDIAKRTGTRLVSADRKNMFRRIEIPRGKLLKYDECAREVLDADVFINMPIAKVHSSSTITASIKNLMGTNWDRDAWHKSTDLEQCIADYSTVVKPDLIILDAVRILLTKGPRGPGDTKDVGQVVAGVDPVAIDSYAAVILGKNPTAVNHLKYANKLGLGQIDYKKLKVKRV